MLRRVASVVTRPTAQPIVSQRRGCVDKWYGHLADMAPVYDWSDEDPHEANSARKRTPHETTIEVKNLPKVEFMSTWEVDNMERPRYWHDDMNPPIYDFWAPSALEIRLEREVDKNLIQRAMREIPAGATDEEKDVMMNDIHEEELVVKDDRLTRAKKVNWFAHCNMVDILPDPLREKVRLDIYEDLHLFDRQEIKAILKEWVPLKYRLEAAPDGRKMAIDSPKHRQQFLDAIVKVREQFSSEATGDKEASLNEVCEFYRRQYDPYPFYNEDQVRACTDLASLEQVARDLFYYNGDKLIFSCWRQAAKLREKPQVIEYINAIESEWADPVIDFNTEQREFYELFQKSIPLTEKEFLVKQMAENPVLEETLKHSSDIHILEEIEAFYNEHIDAEKDVVDALVTETEGPSIVAAMMKLEAHSNAHYIGCRKYRTLSHELVIYADKHPEDLAEFKAKIIAMGNHHSQPGAPFEARVTLGLRVFDALMAAEPHFPQEEITMNERY